MCVCICVYTYKYMKVGRKRGQWERIKRSKWNTHALSHRWSLAICMKDVEIKRRPFAGRAHWWEGTGDQRWRAREEKERITIIHMYEMSQTDLKHLLKSIKNCYIWRGELKKRREYYLSARRKSLGENEREVPKKTWIENSLAEGKKKLLEIRTLNHTPYRWKRSTDIKACNSCQ